MAVDDGSPIRGFRGSERRKDNAKGKHVVESTTDQVGMRDSVLLPHRVPSSTQGGKRTKPSIRAKMKRMQVVMQATIQAQFEGFTCAFMCTRGEDITLPHEQRALSKKGKERIGETLVGTTQGRANRKSYWSNLP